MRNILYKANVIDPAEELAPPVRIAPFSGRYLYRGEASESQMRSCLEYLGERFGTYTVQPKARICIDKALGHYALQPDDVVTILTASGNFYISSCVTKAIEKVCRWSMEITPKTKVLLVNHEFGYPFRNWDFALSFNLPIIEDCAYAFLTSDDNIGKHGDFVIYSLPKAFPMQMGAILKSNVECSIDEDEDVKRYVLNSLALEIENIPEISSRRLANMNHYLSRLAPLGVRPFFGSAVEGVVPGTFLFSWAEDIDYPALKKFMQYNGVECSCFYGKPAFFIPVHQNLTENELDYCCDLLEYFYKTSDR